MLQKYLACLILLWTFTCEVEVKSQDLGYIILKGTCFDYGTGPDIESEIYSIKNGQKIHLGNSNKNGYFRIKVPTDSRAILFKSRGFHDIELPTQFFGKITKEVEFSVILPTSLLDSARVTIEDMLYIETQKSYKNNYNVLITNNKDCTIDFDKNSLDNSPRSSNIRLTKGPQLIGLQLKSLSNDMIIQQPITAGNGMNFLVIDMPKQTIEDDISPKGNIEPGAYLFRIIYFDQSSYKLPE